MRGLLLIVIALLMVSCGDSRQTDYYYDDFPGSEGDKVWNLTDFPLVINVPFELAIFGDEIQAAGDQWSQALGFEAFVFDYGIPNYQYSTVREPLEDSFFGIFSQELWELTDSKGEDIENSVLAITTIASFDGTIVHADIVFNFDFHTFGDVNNPDRGFELITIDFESVLVHELGHYLGLKHVSVAEDPDSVMKSSLNRGEERRSLSIQDGERIRRLYINL